MEGNGCRLASSEVLAISEKVKNAYGEARKI